MKPPSSQERKCGIMVNTNGAKLGLAPGPIYCAEKYPCRFHTKGADGLSDIDRELKISNERRKSTSPMGEYDAIAKEIVGKWGYEEEYWWRPIAKALLEAEQRGYKKAEADVEKDMENTPWANAWRGMAKQEGRQEVLKVAERMKKPGPSSGMWPAALKTTYNQALSDLLSRFNSDNK